MPVLAHHHMRPKARAHQAHQIVGAHLVGLQAQDADAVEADIGAGLDDAAVIGGVGIAAAMADQAAMRRDAALAERPRLLGAAHAVLRVGDDRHARRALRDAGGIEELAFERRDRRRAGRHLDRAGPHAGVADAVGDLADVELRNFFGGTRAPVDRQAHRLEIEARGAHHVHLGFLRDLRHQRGVAAELDRAGIDEGADTVLLAQLAQALDRLGDETRAVEGRGGIILGAGERDEQMLVHQGAPEPIQSDRAENRLYLHSGTPSRFGAPRLGASVTGAGIMLKSRPLWRIVVMVIFPAGGRPDAPSDPARRREASGIAGAAGGDVRLPAVARHRTRGSAGSKSALAPLDLTHMQFILLAATSWLSRDGGMPSQTRIAGLPRWTE